MEEIERKGGEESGGGEEWVSEDGLREGKGWDAGAEGGHYVRGELGLYSKTDSGRLTRRFKQSTDLTHHTCSSSCTKIRSLELIQSTLKKTRRKVPRFPQRPPVPRYLQPSSILKIRSISYIIVL